MDELRAQIAAMSDLAKCLFEQQFIRSGGRKPADPTWDELDESERDDWWDRAQDVAPLLAEKEEVLARLHTWQGLMSLLDEHYPPEVFDRSSGDEGPRVVALVREIDRLRSHNTALVALNSAEHDNYEVRASDLEADLGVERSSRQAWAEEAMRLQEEIAAQRKRTRWILSDGLGHACFGSSGVPGECTSLDAHMSGCPDSPWAERDRSAPTPPPSTVCACVTDEQAASLGPRFSRPVCAVHPPKPVITSSPVDELYHYQPIDMGWMSLPQEFQDAAVADWKADADAYLNRGDPDWHALSDCPDETACELHGPAEGGEPA